MHPRLPVGGTHRRIRALPEARAKARASWHALSCVLLAVVAAGQEPVSRPAPQIVLSTLNLSTATIQDLQLPQSGRQPFEVLVILDGRACTLSLVPQRGRAATNETRRRPLGGSAASGKP